LCFQKKALPLRSLIEKIAFFKSQKNLILYNIMSLINYVHEQMSKQVALTPFSPGDNITVNYRIIEGVKERIQAFRGDVIAIRGEAGTRTFIVRKISNGIGVERIFLLNSPNIDSVIFHKRGKVRRAKLFYLRALVGKKARIKEKKSGSQLV
jgi:large subunit ribosomal protein L19